MRPRFGNFAAAWAFPFLVTRAREAPLTEVSDKEEVTPTKLDLPKGAVRAAEKADLTKAVTEAGDEDDEEDQIAREDAMTQPRRKT